MTPIDFDPAKDLANRAKHGLSLADAAELDWDGANIVPDHHASIAASCDARPMVCSMTGCMSSPSPDEALGYGSLACVVRTRGRPGAMDQPINPDDYEDIDIDDPDNPELTDEDFARARGRSRRCFPTCTRP